MNNKGQTLIMFIILIPVFLILTAIIVDVGIIEHSYQKYKGIVDESIKEFFLNNGTDSLEKTLSYNMIPKENYEIVVEDDTVTVLVKSKIDSIFGKLININDYEINVNRIGKIKDGNIIIEKKETE